jgi:serine beta-lactamase-like protein LACTB, mitochondrial
MASPKDSGRFNALGSVVTHQEKGQLMKKRIWLVVGLGVIGLIGTLCFKFFEPVFTHNAGWVDLPSATKVLGETLDVDLAKQGAAADLALEVGLKETGAPALSAALSIEGRLVWRGAIGLADVEARVPATYETRFRIGSTSKAVTSVGIGALIDQGRLSLDQTIADFPHAVTLGQVMSHRAGIRNYGLCLCFPIWEHLNRRHFTSIDEEVALVADSSLLFKPGAGFAYTSLGFNLAGRAIEKATGQTFSAYMTQAVFQPLGMHSTSLGEDGAAAPYEAGRGRYKRAFKVDNSIRLPSGGIVSTPSDMVVLGSAMLNNNLLSAKTRESLVTVPLAGRTGGGKVYAYGWRHSDWRLHGGTKSLDSYHHGGTAVGSTSILVIFPNNGIVLSLMMNKGGENVEELSVVADRILEAFIPAA